MTDTNTAQTAPADLRQAVDFKAWLEGKEFENIKESFEAARQQTTMPYIDVEAFDNYRESATTMPWHRVLQGYASTASATGMGIRRLSSIQLAIIKLIEKEHPHVKGASIHAALFGPSAQSMEGILDEDDKRRVHYAVIANRISDIANDIVEQDYDIDDELDSMEDAVREYAESESGADVLANLPEGYTIIGGVYFYTQNDRYNIPGSISAIALEMFSGDPNEPGITRIYSMEHVRFALHAVSAVEQVMDRFRTWIDLQTQILEKCVENGTVSASEAEEIEAGRVAAFDAVTALHETFLESTDQARRIKTAYEGLVAATTKAINDYHDTLLDCDEVTNINDGSDYIIKHDTQKIAELTAAIDAEKAKAETKENTHD